MTGDRPLVLVTGATGAVGPRVVEALGKAGYDVRTFSLDAPRPDMWPSGAHDVRLGDIRNPEDVLAAMHGVDAVIHLAALLHIVNPPDALQDHYRNVNIGGTKTVVDAAIKAGVNRVIYFSTIAVYGPTNGRIIDEETAPRPETFYAETKLEAERIILAARNKMDLPIGTSLRLAAVYGSRIKGNYSHLLQALRRGWFIPVGDGLNRRTLIYDKDAAGAAVLVLQNPAAAGRLYNVSDGQYHTVGEIIEAICHALIRRPPRIFIPVTLVRFAVGLLEDSANWMGLKSPLVRASIDKYVEDVAVDSRRIRKELGFQPTFDLTSGWQDTVDEMKRAGLLKS